MYLEGRNGSDAGEVRDRHLVTSDVAAVCLDVVVQERESFLEVGFLHGTQGRFLSEGHRVLI